MLINADNLLYQSNRDKIALINNQQVKFIISRYPEKI